MSLQLATPSLEASKSSETVALRIWPLTRPDRRWLVIGGEQNVYVDKKGVEDALDRMLPAKLLPPRNNEGVVVVLIIDKSSSMEGPKMDLAKAAETFSVVLKK